MKGTNYLAAFGTVFLFIGFYCIKASFQKKNSTHSNEMKPSTKGLLIVGGILSIALGIFLIAKAVSYIYRHFNSSRILIM